MPDVIKSNDSSYPRIIYVMGIDGSGKSTVSEYLAQEFRNKGYNVEVLWLRFNHFFSKPLLGFCRLVGLTRYEIVDGIRVGYHDFYKSKIVSWLFVWLQYWDAKRVRYLYINRVIKKPNTILILDRYVYDILIDLIQDTHLYDLMDSKVGLLYKNLLPEGTKTILINRELHDVLSVRPEGAVDAFFNGRFKEYAKLASDSRSVSVINNNGTLEELLSEVKNKIGLEQL